MSGSSIPYQLRPNKFIDRQIFIDLLHRFLPHIGIDKYIYVSMGGKHLVDHRAIYRHVGVTSLYSFDIDSEITRRQKVNKPIDSAICEELSSGQLSNKLDEIANRFPETTNFVVWLDYTDPSHRLTQMQEFAAVLAQLRSGDIVKLTLNANQGTLGDINQWKEAGFQNPQQFRAYLIKQKMGEFAPNNLKSVDDTEFPKILAKCVKIAASKIERERNGITFFPIVAVSYRDGQKMFTITVIALKDTETHTPLIRKSIEEWDFASKDWGDVKDLNAPDLSQREKISLDRFLSYEPERILEEIDFLPGENLHSAREAIASYKALHRYYPTFHHVEI